jgi:hypothetical protein
LHTHTQTHTHTHTHIHPPTHTHQKRARLVYGVLLLRGASELSDIVTGCVGVLNFIRATSSGAVPPGGARGARGAGRVGERLRAGGKDLDFDDCDQLYDGGGAFATAHILKSTPPLINVFSFHKDHLLPRHTFSQVLSTL